MMEKLDLMRTASSSKKISFPSQSWLASQVSCLSSNISPSVRPSGITSDPINLSLYEPPYNLLTNIKILYLKLKIPKK